MWNGVLLDVGCEIFLTCGGEMWYGVLLDVGCEIFLTCGGEMWNVQHLAIAAPHHIITTTFYIGSFHIKHHLWRYSKPHRIPRHTISSVTTSHQHLSHTIPLCNTISVSDRTISATLCITLYRLALHPIFTFLTYHNTTFHVLYAIFQITRYIGHIIYASPPHLAPHFTRYCTAFHMLHILHHSTTSDRDHIHRQFHIPLACFA